MTDDEIARAMQGLSGESDDVQTEKLKCGHMVLRCPKCLGVELEHIGTLTYLRVSPTEVRTIIVEPNAVNDRTQPQRLHGNYGCGVVFECRECQQTVVLQIYDHEGSNIGLSWFLRNATN